jgi:hypothetical protein
MAKSLATDGQQTFGSLSDIPAELETMGQQGTSSSMLAEVL